MNEDFYNYNRYPQEATGTYSDYYSQINGFRPSVINSNSYVENYIEPNSYPAKTNNNLLLNSSQYSSTKPLLDIFDTKDIRSIYDSSLFSEKTELISSTLKIFPNNCKFRQKIKIPLGFIVTPFALDSSVFRISRKNIIRCKHCSSYFNPYCEIINDNTFNCSICSKKNIISNQSSEETLYILSEREEYRYPYVEYESDTLNHSVPPPLNLIFLIDTSMVHVSDAYIDIIIESIKNNISKIECDKRATVSIITFDSFIHTYEVHCISNRIIINHIIVTELDEPYNTSFNNFNIHFKTNPNIKELFDKLPSIIKNKASNTSDNCFPGALKFAINLLTKSGGGRITVFLATFPNLGAGSYTPREGESISSSNQECSNLHPNIDFYRESAMEALNKNISVDLFVLTKDSIDLPNIINLCRLTGGDVFMCPCIDLQSHKNRETLKKTITSYFSRKFYLQNSIKIRMKDCYDVSYYYGNFFVVSVKKISIPVMSQYSNFSFQLEMESDIPKSLSSVCFQISILFYCTEGISRLRVFTISLNTSNVYQEIYWSIDPRCSIGILARMACERMYQYSIHDTRTSLLNAAVDLIHSFCMFNGQNVNIGKLLVPVPLYQLVQLIYCLLRYNAFSLHNKIKMDKRAFRLVSLRSHSLNILLNIICPKIYDLTELISLASNAREEFSSLYYQTIVVGSAEHLFKGKVYILDNGMNIYIYLTSGTSPYLVNSMLDLSDYNALPEVMLSLPILSGDFNVFLHYFIELITCHRFIKPNIVIFKDTSKNMTKKFSSNLVLDKSEHMESYQNWLKTVINKIVQNL